MNLLSGLEKLGLKIERIDNLFEDTEENRRKNPETSKPESKEKLETDFLVLKTVRCPICEHQFKSKVVKSSKLQRLDSDDDLRPRYRYIDILKYGVTSCPQCKYSALNDRFIHLAPVQIRLVREGVYARLDGESLGGAVIRHDEDLTPYDYDTAIERHKLAIFSTMVKKGRDSENAYTCLKLAWLYREKRKEVSRTAPEKLWLIEKTRREEEAFYEQAYKGFEKAMLKEDFPISGMNEATLEYLMAVMSFRMGRYDDAAKLIGTIVISRQANEKIKDKARDLKEKVLEAKRNKEI